MERFIIPHYSSELKIKISPWIRLSSMIHISKSALHWTITLLSISTAKGNKSYTTSRNLLKFPSSKLGDPSLIRLKKRRFQCKSCRKVTVSETNLVKKSCQISEPVRQKISQLLLNKEALTHIAAKLAISTSTVYHKLKQCHFKEDYTTLPEVLSWNEFSYQKGKLAFIAQDFNTKKIIIIRNNRCQTTIRNHFFKYSKEARNKGKVVTVDMSGSYIPLIKPFALLFLSSGWISPLD